MQVPYELVKVDYFTAEQKKQEYVKLNPCATLPFAIIPGDQQAITESNAILQYAADLQNDEAFYPKDLLARAQVNRWLLWESSVWFASCYVYLVEHVVKPLLKAQPDQSIVEGEAPRMHRLCKILDDQLAGRRFLTGNHVTIADIAVAAPMHLYAESKLPLQTYPHLLRWQKEEMENIKAWTDTLQDVMCLVPDCNRPFAADIPISIISAGNGPHFGNSDSVQAVFNYTKDIIDDPPTLYFYDDPKADKVRAPGDHAVQQTIHNGWPQAANFSVDREGFALKNFATKFDDWESVEKVKAHFYPEVVQFLKAATGARRVLVFDHTIRAARNEVKKLTQETDTTQRSPVLLVHCDYTAESGPTRIRQLLGDEAEELLKARAAFINVWKPIRRVVEERPLAMCDATSSPDADFLKLYLHYRDRIGENYVLRYSESQKWYYFPRMKPDQVILLKTYDSATDGTARFVGHTAFIDPTSSPEAPMRESCEIRTILFF